jgi:diguanylate cyclase (GGDEF)-like protein
MILGWKYATNVPGTLALFALMALLLPLRKRASGFMMRSWLWGFTFLLLTNVFWFLKEWPLLGHMLILECQLFAAISFACFRAHRDEPRIDLWYVLLNTLPLAVIECVYGFYDLHPAPYLWAAAAGVLLMVLTTHWRRMPIRYLLLAVPGYALLAWLASAGHYRTVAYWILAALFGLTWWRVRQRLPVGGTGRLVLLSSLMISAAHDGFHPVIVLNPPLQALTDEVFLMQKFFLVIGMLLVLLEHEAARHERQALHDNLTGLPNRRRLDHWLEEKLATAAKTGHRVSVMAIDLNGFKAINDLYGHAAGDAVLRELAVRLSASLGPDDLAARLGGDEFVMGFVSAIDEASPSPLNWQRAHAIKEMLLKPVAWRDTSLRVGASLGVASFPDDIVEGDTHEIAASLLDLADRSMYRHKQRAIQVTAAEGSAAR